jgi:alkanesulfonate monooxygenase SsuD/methylene tetrahydromethanopterin reductase-like flavin-dependent oxidoreductase (luciferase family)
MNFGIWHNGTTNLPLKETDDGLVIPDASLAEMNADRQQVSLERIEHGILAEEHGFDRLTFTEHHFIITGCEYSPNPLMTQTAIAAQTDDIKLRQVANILPWHDPIRFAEQSSLLDLISDGRTEVGVGRGYQPREGEVLGQYWGGSVDYDEQNRKSFEEKVEIVRKAWTEDMFSYSGEFHEIPPSYTHWHHPHEAAYLESEACEYDVEDMIEWKEDSVDESELNPYYPNVVSEASSTLKSINVFPKPQQDPHPIMWQPVGSRRSTKYAAERGINPYLSGSRTLGTIKDAVEMYYEEVEAAGWPDHRPEYDGEPFERPWDQERQRGLTLYVPVFNTDVGSEDTFERWKLGMKAYRQSIGFFGLLPEFLTGQDEGHPLELLRKLSADEMLERTLWVAGDEDDIIDRLVHITEELDAEDIAFDIAFENVGITGEEANEQLRAFADRVMPYMLEEYPSA